MILFPWGYSRQEYWSGCHDSLQWISPTQGLNPGLPHCRWILYHLNHHRSPTATNFIPLLLSLTHFHPQFSHSVVSNSLWPHGLQHARTPCPLSVPGVYSNSCQLSRYSTQPSHPLSSPSSPAFNLSHHQGLFQWISSSNQVAKGLRFQLQLNIHNWFPLGSPCNPRDSQEFSPTPQFKSINSLVLSFLYSLTLTSIHDYWKNHTFD